MGKVAGKQERHAITSTVAGGRNTVQFWREILQKLKSLLFLPHFVQCCTQQLQRWLHGAIQPLRAISYRMSGPLRALY